jgi:hypothetical protein
MTNVINFFVSYYYVFLYLFFVLVSFVYRYKNIFSLKEGVEICSFDSEVDHYHNYRFFSYDYKKYSIYSVFDLMEGINDKIKKGEKLEEEDINMWNFFLDKFKPYWSKLVVLMFLKSIIFPIYLIMLFFCKFYKLINFIINNINKLIEKFNVFKKMKYNKEVLVLKESESYRTQPSKQIENL